MFKRRRPDSPNCKEILDVNPAASDLCAGLM
jgi:hypothetical protein